LIDDLNVFSHQFFIFSLVGIIPRAVLSLFNLVDEKKKAGALAVKVKMSYFEIYNNKGFHCFTHLQVDMRFHSLYSFSFSIC